MYEPHEERFDPYATLSLHPEAPQQLIDEAYWLLARIARERLAPGPAVKRIGELTAAYEMISNGERRRDYHARAGLLFPDDVGTSGAVNKILEFPFRDADVGLELFEMLRIAPDADGELIDLARGIAARHGTARSAQRVHTEVTRPRRKPQPDWPTTTLTSPTGQTQTSGRLRAIESDLALEYRQNEPDPRAMRAERSSLVLLDDELSARRVITAPQKVTGIALLLIAAVSIVVWPLASIIGLITMATLIYASAIAYKGYLGFIAMAVRGETPIEAAQLAALSDDVLPIYTVILPVYRETAVLAGLVESIAALDYPTDKLDVKLLLEEDDIEMQRAVAALSLPDHFERLIVPDIGPKGKPRACNYGLSYARGTYLALYDAEDRPEPDQLKKALVAFAVGGQDVACVQAKLNFYNPDQNLLTKWFTIEYSTWFDLYLPALNSIGAPIPLGGTSNHFRVNQLRAIGAWDPFNVTEDADLGVRLARYHLTTSVIDSTTYEEANSRLGNWLRQRSRWVKGYMQTWLVHMRHPLTLFTDLGAAGFFAFQVMVFGTFFTYFINPVFWALVIAWYATHAAGIEALFPAPVLYLSAFAFFAGNFVFIFTTVAGSLQRGFYHGVKYALINHIYWALMSVASWKALAQLVRRPHYWEKTQHGLSTVTAPHRTGGAR